MLTHSVLPRCADTQSMVPPQMRNREKPLLMDSHGFGLSDCIEVLREKKAKPGLEIVWKKRAQFPRAAVTNPFLLRDRH